MNGRAFGRGVIGRCPRCGSRGIFASINDLKERCPQCGLGFEREHGYWLGAMAVSIGTVLFVFTAMFVGTMLVTWPDVPWNGIVIVGVITNGLIPILGYGWSKTTWLGIDMTFNPASPVEEAEAIAANSVRDLP